MVTRQPEETVEPIRCGTTSSVAQAAVSHLRWHQHTRLLCDSFFQNVGQISALDTLDTPLLLISLFLDVPLLVL